MNDRGKKRMSVGNNEFIFQSNKVEYDNGGEIGECFVQVSIYLSI